MGFDKTVLVGNDKQIYNYRHIKIDKFNNKYLVGFFKGTLSLGTFTINTKPSITNSNYPTAQGVFMAKFDSNNNLSWLRKIAEGDTLFSSPLTVDNLCNQYLSINYGGILYYEADSLISQGGIDGAIIVYDSNNVIKHVNKIGGVNGDELSSTEITVDEKSNYFVYGSYNYTWSGISLNYQLIIGSDTLIANNQDMFIAKYDSLGNPIWAKSYGGGSGYAYENISGLAILNNKIYITGNVLSMVNNNIGGITFNYSVNYTHKGFVAKLDSSGNGVWVRKCGDQNVLSTYTVGSVVAKDNRIYFFGGCSSNTQSVFHFEGGPTLTGNGNSYDYFIAAYDTEGNFKWNTMSNSVDRDAMAQLAVDSNSNVYGVGSMNYTSRFPTDTLSTHGYDDALVVSYDSIGTFRWAINGGGAGTDVGNGIALDSHGKPYIVGGTTSSGGCYMGNDTLYPPSNQSTLFFASIDSIAIQTPLSNANFSMVNSELKVFPNPASTLLNVEDTANSFKEGEIELYNVVGQLIYTLPLKQPSTGNMQLKIDVSQLPNGIYYLQLKNKQSSITKKINIQH